MILIVIVACEIGFWVLLGAGLVARYALRLPRTSTVLLASVPAVDLVLLVATVLDLSRGALATPAHGLAALYIGFSLAFGHRVISTADAWVSHRFRGGPAPIKAPRTGPGRIRHSWGEWLRALTAYGIACALLLTAILVVGDSSRTAELRAWVGWLSAALVVWLLSGPVWSSWRHRTVSS